MPLVELRESIGAASDNALHRAIVRLREKIEEDPRSPRHLVTLRGSGLALFETPKALQQPAPMLLLERPALEAQITEALVSPGVVTLLGPGGIGKTTLASAVARGSLGSLICELVPARTADDLWRIVAGVAAEPVPADLRAARGLARALERRGGVLVVLDNAEHLIDAVRDAADALQSEAPSVKLLVTSRVPLGLPRERRIQVPMLDLDEAAALFRLRGGRAEDDAALRALAAALDPMPLVVEVLAHQAAHLPLAQISERLRGPSAELLSLHSPPHLPERHQTLDRALRCSWELLAPPIRRSLAALSAIPCPMSVDLAERLCEGEPLDALQTLVDAGLLRAAQGVVSLLEVVRRFAAAQPEACPPVALREALAWAIERTTLLPGSSEKDLVAETRQEIDLLWGIFRETADLAPEARADLARQMLPICRWMPLGSRHALCEVVIASGQGLVSALAERSALSRYAGDEPAALADLGAALSLYPSAEELVWILGERALLYRQMGEFDLAERDLREAIALKPDGAGPLTTLAYLLSYTGRMQEIPELAARAAPTASESQRSALASLALASHSRSDPASALAGFDALRASASSAVRLAFIDSYRGAILEHMGRSEEAAEAFLAAERSLVPFGYAVPLAEIRCRIAWGEARRGALARAREILAPMCRSEGYPGRLGQVWLALVEASLGDPEASSTLARFDPREPPRSDLALLRRAAHAQRARRMGDEAPWVMLCDEVNALGWLVLPSGLPG